MQIFADVGQWWLFVLGVAVVLLTLFDVVWTVIAALATHHRRDSAFCGRLGNGSMGKSLRS